MLALALAACGDRGSGLSTTVVAKATASARTFRMAGHTRIFVTGHPDQVREESSPEGEVDLDRRAVHTGGATDEELVMIGADVWMHSMDTIVGRPWVHLRRPEGTRSPTGAYDPVAILASLRTAGARLEPAGHERVRGVATTHYAVRFPQGRKPPGGETLEVWTDKAGVMRRLRMTYETPADGQDPATTEDGFLDFYDFGAAVSIEPPPPDQVSEAPGGVSTGPDITSQPETPPSLPAPTVHGPSPLQLRPVRAVHTGSCPSGAVDPAADQPALLPGPDGSCYDLEPAALVVTRAETTPRTGEDGSVTVDFTLGAADAAGFNRLAEANLGGQVALVFLGRVVTAPTIQASQFNGHGQIAPLQPQEAANLIAALSG
ncbi:MAG TPA: hypothetical protein VFJ85_05605 [Acidimicrobiales bacterium]|nr:hypothetical protein [Acidimicrobiales bacterium]